MLMFCRERKEILYKYKKRINIKLLKNFENFEFQ